MKTEREILQQITPFLLACLLCIVGCQAQESENEKLKEEIARLNVELNHVDGGNIELDSLKNLVDSLHNEVFMKEVIIGKYEITLELLKETNEKAAAEFEHILTTQTE